MENPVSMFTIRHIYLGEKRQEWMYLNEEKTKNIQFGRIPNYKRIQSKKSLVRKWVLFC